MTVLVINPKNNSPLTATKKGLIDKFGNVFKLLKGLQASLNQKTIPRTLVCSGTGLTRRSLIIKVMDWI